MINIYKEDSIICDEEFRKNALKMFNDEYEERIVKSSVSHTVNRETFSGILLASSIMMALLFISCRTFDILFITLALGLITVSDIIDSRVIKKKKGMTRLYLDYIITNDWEVFVDRANALVNDKDTIINGTYVLSIDDGNLNVVITEEQFKALYVLDDTESAIGDKVAICVDLREAIQFENRLLDGDERYNNLDIYDFYSNKD